MKRGRTMSGLLLGVLAACAGDSAPPASAARVVALQELAAAVKQNLGRGALVNLWATW